MYKEINKQIRETANHISFVENPTKNLKWRAEDLIGNNVIGSFKGKDLFQIKKGTLAYILTILDESLYQKNDIVSNPSIQLNRVKSKAEKIFEKHYFS